MNHIAGILLGLITMISKYFTVVVIFLFDSFIFGYPIQWINNNMIADNFSTPILSYFDVVGLIFLFKLIALLWKSVTVAIEDDNVINNKEE